MVKVLWNGLSLNIKRGLIFWPMVLNFPVQRPFNYCIDFLHSSMEGMVRISINPFDPLNLFDPFTPPWQGTMVDEAKVLIASSALRILPVSDLEETIKLNTIILYTITLNTIILNTINLKTITILQSNSIQSCTLEKFNNEREW